MLTITELSRGNSYRFHATGDWAEYLDQAASPPASKWKPLASKKVRDKTDNWYGTMTYEEAVKLAKKGWPEGRNEFSDMTGQAIRTIERSKPQRGYDVAGMYPDVPRFLGGEQGCMVYESPDYNQRTKIIPIYVGMFHSSGIGHDVFYRRGGAIAGLIDYLEDNLHSVELWSYCHSESYPHKCWIEVCIKKAGEPLDIDRLAFVLVHPSWFRRIQFSVHESLGHVCDGRGMEWRNGYGSPPGTVLPNWLPNMEQYEKSLIFPGVALQEALNWTTIEGSVDHVLKQWDEAVDRALE